MLLQGLMIEKSEGLLYQNGQGLYLRIIRSYRTVHFWSLNHV